MKAEYIDHLGDDLRVVNAARVSFDTESEWELEEITGEDVHGAWTDDVQVLSKKDQKLIKYLAKHEHWTPFSHVMITMRETVPIFVARQRFKHMVGFTYNEVSRRYVDDIPEYYIPDSWRSRPVGSVKQGSGTDTLDFVEFGQEVLSIKEEYADFIRLAEDMYDFLIKTNVAPEMARMVLPQSAYTEYYVTGSLSAWSRAYKLRSSSDAQLEIQTLAAEWKKVISGIDSLKHSWSALSG